MEFEVCREPLFYHLLYLKPFKCVQTNDWCQIELFYYIAILETTKLYANKWLELKLWLVLKFYLQTIHLQNIYI